jgi:hypothetical protein
MQWLLGIASALVLGVLAWVFTPIRNWLEPLRLRATSDHGVRLRVFVDPDEMQGLDVEGLIGIPAGYLPGVNFYFRSDSPPAEPPVPGESWWQWAKRLGGEDVFASHILLLLQSTQERAVAVGVPRVTRQLDRAPRGIVCGPDGQGGNGLLVRRFYINLDQGDPPRAKFFANGGADTARFTLSKGETVALLVIAETMTGRHQWKLSIPLDVDGQHFELPADNHGNPFVTVGGEGLTFFMAPHGQAGWVPASS